MAKDTTANPVTMAQLSQDLVVISGDLRDGLSTARESVLVDTTAFGNTEGVEDLSNAYNSVLEKAGLAVEDLAEVLEGDIDRVLLMAFSYQQQDEDNARRIPAGRNGPI